MMHRAEPAVGTTRRRRWAMRLGAVVLPPLLVLGGLELALHLAGYGYPTGFFLKATHDRQGFLVDNPRFAWRFMAPALARTPLPLELPSAKAANAYRIFVFGESAAMGDPEPAFGFCRVLQVLLGARYPGRRFEVINTAFPAINSHVIRDIARDCTGASGDLWVIYMGNNEVLGPYGATRTFGLSAPPARFLRANLLLRQFRAGQLLSEWVGRWRGPRAVNSGEMQEALLDRPVPVDDFVLPRIYRHFEENLEAVLDAGTRCGARVLVNTLVSNLKDCGPFLPGGKPELEAAFLAEWERRLREGSEALAAAAPARALECLTQAANLAPRHAELQFQLGRTYLALGRTNEARRHLEQARDLDAFRARADSHINQTIRKVAKRHEHQEVRLIDAESAFLTASSGGVTGDELLCDHVHFRFEGNYLLARLQAYAVSAWLPQDQATGNWLTVEECARRLAFTDWSRYRFATALRRQLSGTLFRRQSNHAERDGRLRQELRRLESASRPEAFPTNLAACREAIERSPRDWVLYDQLGWLALASGDRPGAATAWRNAVQVMPHGFPGHYQLGLLLNQPGTAAEALPHLLAARELRPLLPEVHAALGTAYSHEQRLPEADRAFERALALDPKNAATRVAWAESLSARGQLPAARAQLDQAIALNTNNLAAHLRLATLLVKQQDRSEAAKQFREVLRLDPRNETARRFVAESGVAPSTE